MFAVKYHFNCKVARETLPPNCSTHELKERIKILFNLQEPFVMKVATTKDSVAITSDAQWIEIVKKIVPGLIHIQISTDIIETPENNSKNNIKLVSPKTPCKFELSKKIENGDGIIVSGRVQTMPFEDLHWCFSLCNSEDNKNSPFVREFIKSANEIGFVNYKYKYHKTPINPTL